MFSLNKFLENVEHHSLLLANKRDQRISIFGLGYVGIVSTACLAERGHEVIGVDIDQCKLDMVLQGKSPIVEPGLNRLLAHGVSGGFIDVTSDALSAVCKTDISFVSVGTPSKADGSSDLTHLRNVAREIGAALAVKCDYHTVVFRSTAPPGTTRDILLPLLEESSGKVAGRDFGLCFHPEFLRETTAIADFYDSTKTVIGGFDRKSRETVATLYAGIDENIIETDLEAAEMVKYVDNSWHALKVSFSNEIGKICQAMAIDSHEVMDIFVRDTKLNLSPYYLKPGFAFGGSCLPKDLREMNHLADELHVETPILDNILVSNQAQIDHVLDLIKATNPRHVTFLGVTFKAGTDDLRESPVLPMMADCLQAGIDVKFFDPNVDLSGAVQHHLNGAKRQKENKTTADVKLPHLMSRTIEEACENASTIVVCHDTEEFRRAVAMRKPSQKVIDLVRIFERNEGWAEMAEAGMNDYLQKPARTDALRGKIDRATGALGQQMHILLAEDDPANAAVICAKLTKLGHRVEVVKNGLEAVRAVQFEAYDLILMDISMPVMDGKEATRRIRAFSNERGMTPIIALTAFAAPEESATYQGICW